MEVRIKWEYTEHEEDSMDFTRVLYAYLHPESREILYVGKAGLCSVGERTKGEHKSKLFKYFKDEIGLDEYFCIVGVLYIPEGKKFSSELLSDVESLLIIQLQPIGNIQSKESRVSRPELTVVCSGEWPSAINTFFDD